MIAIIDGLASRCSTLSRKTSAKHPNRNSPPKLGGVARRRFISRDGVVPKPRTTPSARNKVASRLFIDRAATPPNLGGEFLFGCFTTFGIILKFEWFHVCSRSF